MAFTSLEGTKIIVKEEGTNYMNFIASGTIVAGQAVKIAGAASGSDQAKVQEAGSTPESSFIGVAGFDVTSGNRVIVVVKGNKVWSRASGSVSAGDIVTACDGGYFKTSTFGGGSGSGNILSHGIALSDASDDGVLKILLQ